MKNVSSIALLCDTDYSVLSVFIVSAPWSPFKEGDGRNPESLLFC
jgi:hypothetical protein